MSLASNAQTEKAIDVPCPNEWAMLTASEAGATDRIAYPCIHGAGTTHRKLPRQVDSSKVDSPVDEGLGRNVRGGTRPRLSCGRSWL